MQASKTKLDKHAHTYLYLPLLCAVLMETHTRFLLLKGDSGALYLTLAVQLLLESVPFFIAHYFAHTLPKRAGMGAWSLGFVGYPLLVYLLASTNEAYAAWSLLTIQAWALMAVASIAWMLSRSDETRRRKAFSSYIVKLFSLNAVVAALLMVWAFVMAGAFVSSPTAIDANAQTLVIEIDDLYAELGRLLNYLWQFVLLAALLGGLFLFNRYYLVRHLLAKQGVLLFVAAVLVCTILLTPCLFGLLLSLPMNEPDLLFFPSDRPSAFAPENYRLMFAFFAICTPLILVFERQAQQAALATIAQEQTHTELKLLQQQINPHFLFNTLNNLYALTLTKSDDAPTLVMQLSKLLRYTVYEGQKEKVSLAQEIDYLKNYISLQQIRFHARCTLDLTWPDRADGLRLPPLLIIMLLENAFKYGVEPTSQPSHVRFHMTLNDNRLSVECDNPIFATVPSEDGGVGLENLRRRLQLQFPGRHTLESAAIGNLWRAKMTLELETC